MKEFDELVKLEKVLERIEPFGSVEKLATVDHGGQTFPIYGLRIGAAEKRLPTFGLFGGVHGLEKIGSQLVTAYIDYLANQLSWDASLVDLFQKSRLVSIPMVNPVGVYFNRRSNGNGVDIMRNGPIDAEVVPEKPSLVSGHGIGPWLPWYRGRDEMEVETQTLTDFVRRELFASEMSLSLDIHSGFGFRDRLWYPYSKSKEKFPLFDQAIDFKKLLKKSIPYHVYKVEQQSDSYLIQGDPWDYLFEEHYSVNQGKSIYIPWTLEMGSWLWVRKNPKQLLSYKGIFNPMVPHRFNRVMRRHRPLLELFQKAVFNNRSWSVV
ncbi:MAG: zinc carboxypeptidase [Bdellovibrionales bacterium]|nr:zinc carboxypeptidase [Bdellovibrionales bacterium]